MSIKDSRSYYIYSSVPDKLRDTWAWDKKIFIKGDKTAPHVFIDGVNIEMSPSSKGPAIELNKKASAYIYFIGKNSSLQGADGRAAIQKNRSEGQLYVLARTGTTVTCKGGDKAAGIGGSYATRNISNGYYNGDMYGHGVNMHFGSQSNPDYWGGIIAAIGGNGGAGIGGGQGGAGEKLYFYSGTDTSHQATDLLPVLAAAMRVAAVRSIFMVAQSALKAVREALVSAVAAGKRSRI
ncbi:glycine-rich cell wall structural protein [human gut metagenome]|uniref:Glycine-rich cell wall structural protein n=1 Tax=human gut metagenome TaxID=408170 RepID=K1UYX3_9ZZZZ